MNGQFLAGQLNSILKEFGIPPDEKFIEVLVKKYLERDVIHYLPGRTNKQARQELKALLKTEDFVRFDEVVIKTPGRIYRFKMDRQVLSIFEDHIDELKFSGFEFSPKTKYVHPWKHQVERLKSHVERCCDSNGVVASDRKINILVYDLLSLSFNRSFPNMPTKTKKSKSAFNQVKAARISKILK